MHSGQGRVITKSVRVSSVMLSTKDPVVVDFTFIDKRRNIRNSIPVCDSDGPWHDCRGICTVVLASVSTIYPAVRKIPELSIQNMLSQLGLPINALRC